MAEEDALNNGTDQLQSESTGENDQEPEIYHERQSKQLCALHALNNLFQDPKAFSKKDLDVICSELAPNSRLFNPHRSAFGLGCYDVNVIIAALSKKLFEVIWFDKRRNLQNLNLNKIYGFILNIPNRPSNGFIAVSLDYIPVQAQIWSSQKHWIAIRKIGSRYYDLDSKLTSPCNIGNDENLLQYLGLKNSTEQVEILIVVPKSVEEDHSWYNVVH